VLEVLAVLEEISSLLVSLGIEGGEAPFSQAEEVLWVPRERGVQPQSPSETKRC